MTLVVADSDHFGHGQIMLARVCAARLDATIAAEEFVRMVARLVDVAVAEAIEDLAPLPHVRVEAKDRVPQGIAEALDSLTKCPFCHERLGGPIVEHDCTRKRELGFSSTGAADAGSSADHRADQRAASEAPAAPSIPPRAQGSNHRGSTPAFTDAERESLRAEYDAACKRNDGAAPYGWLSKKAAELGVGVATIHRTVHGKTQAKTKQSEPEIPVSETDVDRNAAPIERQPVDKTAPASGPVANGHAQSCEHTNSHGCWCRKSPNTSANRWCSNKPPTKPIGTLAGMQYRVTRMQGTRY